jgi:hypothetical protein
LLTESDALPSVLPSIGAADTPTAPTTPRAAVVKAVNNSFRIETSIVASALTRKLLCANLVASIASNVFRWHDAMNIRSL